MLGNLSETTLYEWKANKYTQILSDDVIERISYIIGIYKSLNILIPLNKDVCDWIKKPNKGSLFKGDSALKYMLKGKVEDLTDVYCYLNAQC